MLCAANGTLESHRDEYITASALSISMHL